MRLSRRPRSPPSDADEFVKRGSNRLVVEKADKDFLNDGQGDQQHEAGERLCSIG
jgi:hypothetical protein